MQTVMLIEIAKDVMTYCLCPFMIGLHSGVLDVNQHDLLLLSFFKI
jgi:hypothetical protein